MAAREHRVSRRVLLGAACALPLIRHPELDSGSIPPPARPSSSWTLNQVQGDDRWRNALIRFRRAEEILKAAAHEPDEDLYDAINGTFHNALRRLLRTPAPDLPALSLKIDLAVDHEIAELTGGDRCLAVLKQDARRLAGLKRI